MLKAISKFLLIIGIFFFLTRPVFAENETTLHFFWAIGCPHCSKEKIFLNELKEKYPKLIIKDYEITTSSENVELLQETGKLLQTDIAGVPFTVVGEDYFVGYLNDETTSREIENAVRYATENGYKDIINGLSQAKQQSSEKQTRGIPQVIKVPVFGELQVKNLSLPALTLIVAALDGFNPCAMWVLLFLISLLLGFKDKKRMWILGIAFIVTSGLAYFLFLSAWLNLFLFLGFVVWIRVLIGLIALGTGGYYLRDYWKNRSGTCAVTGNEKRQKIFEKIHNVVQKRQLILAFGGIVLLAIAVNMIELICSAGLPAVYTKILSLSNLQTWQYYLYLLFYIFIFMLDDLFVFFTAMITLHITGIQGKYSRFSHLIGGILMLIIGLLLLFKPELLMFG